MQRILGGIVPTNLEMEMRPAYPSRAPDSRHDLTSNHTLPSRTRLDSLWA